MSRFEWFVYLCKCRVYQQVSLGDARATLPWNFVTARHINHVDDEVRKLPTEVCGQIICPKRLTTK